MRKLKEGEFVPKKQTGCLSTPYTLAELQNIVGSHIDYKSMAKGINKKGDGVAPLPAEYAKYTREKKGKKGKKGKTVKIKKGKTIKKIKDKKVKELTPKPVAPVDGDPLTPYLEFAPEDYGKFRKRAHSKVYHLEFDKCNKLGYTRARCRARARLSASKEIKRWQFLVTR